MIRFARASLSTFLVALASFRGLALPAGADTRPNVVLIMTDNHGAWALGCYGNQDIKTPHIDRLASEGVLFTRCFANNPVCSPTRATFLTGLMPCQHGVHRYLGAGGAQIGPEAYNTLAEFDTLPSLLADAGYTCGLSGKWHLGGNLHPQEGFTFWVTMPHGHTRGFYDQRVIEDGEIRNEPTYLTKYWTDRGIEFIEANRERPFFLFLAYNGPYGLGRSMLEPIRNRHEETYADAALPSFPRRKPHPWNHDYGGRVGDPRAIRRYAAEISAIDDGVGRILETLRRLDLERRTLVVFTADQGLAGGHSGFWGMGDHTRPLTAFDWTMHIPLIFRHPPRMPAGRRVDLLVSNVDFLPTMLEYLGLPWKSESRSRSPGRSFGAALEGRDIEGRDDTVFYEFENVRAIRTDRWKYIERFRESPDELYDLRADPGELENLIESAEHAAVRRRLGKRLHDWFDGVADPKWDLWKGGTSKTGLIMRKVFDHPGPAPPPRTDGLPGALDRRGLRPGPLGTGDEPRRPGRRPVGARPPSHHRARPGRARREGRAGGRRGRPATGRGAGTGSGSPRATSTMRCSRSAPRRRGAHCSADRGGAGMTMCAEDIRIEPMASENGAERPSHRLQVGDRVRAHDRDNVGTVEAVDGDRIDVHFVGKDGEETKTFSPDLLTLLERNRRNLRKEPLRLLGFEDVVNLEPPDWLIQDYLPERSLAVLYGDPGCGKSFVALDMALSVASGADWQKSPVQAGPVVYVAAEGSGGIGKRVRAWLMGRRPTKEQMGTVAENLFALPEIDRRSHEHPTCGTGRASGCSSRSWRYPT